jgi:Rod binding domain-containing protein
MTLPVAPPPSPSEPTRPESSVRRPAPERPEAKAARELESLLVRQLLAVLRKTVPKGGLLDSGDSSGAQYLEMFDDALANALSEGGGLGMQQSLQQALGAEPVDGSGTVRTQLTGEAGPTRTTGTLATGVVPSRGATGLLAKAAESMVSPEAAARWSRSGTLGTEDLASGIATSVGDGVARFNVRDALGYQGYYKCNLFAFELARRAGYAVPVVGRGRGWGFPGADTVARDAASDGRVRGDWARVATGQSAALLDEDIRRGERAFLLTASSPGERPGHMAVVERVRSVAYGPAGEVRRIVFDGWEAKPSGARHLTERTWNVVGNEGGTQPHNGFDLIEILELRRPVSGSAPEQPISRPGGASLRDAADEERSSSSRGRIR